MKDQVLTLKIDTETLQMLQKLAEDYEGNRGMATRAAIRKEHDRRFPTPQAQPQPEPINQ